MDDIVSCENRHCQKEITQNDKRFTIPLDETWKWQDGTFCSIKCAIYVNKNEMSMYRQPENYKEREELMLKKERGVGKTDKIKF